VFKAAVVNKAVSGVGSAAGTEPAPAVGLPGERVRAEDGKLMIKEKFHRRQADLEPVATP